MVTITTNSPARTRTDELARVPWWPVGAAVVVACGLLLATSGRYGYHRDELYFRMLAPAWGYVDQPPLTPLLAKAAIAIFGDTPTGMRVPAVLMFAVGIVLATLITRELGGSRFAQALSAWAAAFGGLPLLSGHLMITGSLDLVMWSAVLLCVARAQLRGDPRWWVAAGAVIGIATYNKLLIVMLVLSLVVGFLAVGPRSSLLRERYLWIGAGVAVLLALPNLIFQITHDFPQLTMAGALAENNGDDVRVQVLPMQFLLIGVPLAPIWITGLVAVLRRPAWRPVRAVAIAYLVAVVLTFVGGGQIYYAFGLQAFLLAAAWLPVTAWARSVWRRRWLYVAVVLNAVTGLVVATAIVPITSLHGSVVAGLNPTIGDQVGWPEYVAQVAAVYDGLPADDQAHAVIVTSNYGEAGSIDRYGPQYHLPPVYSGHNQLWFQGPPSPDRTVVLVWTEGDRILKYFDGCSVRATVDNGYGVDNEEQGSLVALCRLPTAGWASVWPSLQHYA